MNLPAGKIVEKGLKLSEKNVEKILSDLFTEIFSGYMIVTVEGLQGIEEGLLLFEKGSLKGAIFEELWSEKELLGEEALKRIANALASREGIAGINSLTKQQVDLIIAFQEKMALQKEYRLEDIKKMIPKESTVKKEEERKESRLDIFKSLGLVGVEKK